MYRYIYICIYMYIYIHVYICIHMRMCMYVCTTTKKGVRFQLLGHYCPDIPLLDPLITRIAPPRKLRDAFQPHSYRDSCLGGRRRACEKGVV